MNSATITITDVTTKEGVSQKTQKPWRAYKVRGSNGLVYDTFDGGMGQQALQNVGKTASITYETNDRGYHDLKSLTITGDTPPPAAPTEKTATGETDWSVIGLRKTRCALWAALLSSDTIKGMPAAAAATFGRELILAAEIDIFHRDPAQPGEDIPF